MRSQAETALLSAEDLAILLNVSKRSIGRYRSAGKIPAPVRIGGSIRWRREEIKDWIAAGCPKLKDWEAQLSQGGEL